MEQQPFHHGEIAVQQKVGEEAMANRNARAISDTIVPGAQKFLENQPFVIVSSSDETGRIWTSILSGEYGYVQILSADTIEIARSRVNSNPYDSFWKHVETNPSIGMLFIELSSRRRFRVNGKVTLEPGKLRITIEQGFPNCPKYIQRRQVAIGHQFSYTAGSQKGSTLTDELVQWISKADTFFVGSSNDQGEMDASHRGGPSGFVTVIDHTTLQIPDYKGNSMYNTLGNFIVKPMAGLLFIDFNQHRTLQITGSTEIIWQDENVISQTGGTGRYWLLSINEWVLLDNIGHMQWHFMDYSPFNPA